MKGSRDRNRNAAHRLFLVSLLFLLRATCEAGLRGESFSVSWLSLAGNQVKICRNRPQQGAQAKLPSDPAYEIAKAIDQIQQPGSPLRTTIAPFGSRQGL